MSSKNDPDSAGQTWSLAARLALWHAASAFALLLAATGFLYWVLGRSLDREDDNQLADQISVLRAILRERPGDLDAVRKEAEEEFLNRQHTQVYVRFLDESGRVLVESPGMGGLVPPALFPSPSASPGVGSDCRASSGTPFRTMAGYAQGASNRYVVQVAMDRSQEVELLGEFRQYLWLVLAAAIFLCGFGGYRIAEQGLRPIRAVAQTAERIRASHFGERLATAGLPAELRELAGTFNAMLDRLEQSFARLSQFSADLAHELRTPVNHLRGEVEVALGKPRTEAEYRDVLGSNLEECGRLSRTIDDLLFLARAENPQTQVEREPLDLAAELATVREFYEPLAQEKGVALALDCQRAGAAELNRALFQRAVGNLLANALAHTPPGGQVLVAAAGDEARAVVRVIDSGEGIAPEHLPHLFERFYRGDAARGSAQGRVGLGLAIVRGIVELHGGSVRIESEPGQGTRAIVSFPRRMTKS